jgi:hypothetical protein
MAVRKSFFVLVRPLVLTGSVFQTSNEIFPNENIPAMPFGLEVKKPSARVVLLEPDHSRRLAPSRTLYRREAKHLALILTELELLRGQLLAFLRFVKTMNDFIGHV